MNKLLIEHNSDVEKIYYLPPPEMVRSEFEKADKALRMFGYAPFSPELEERIRPLEDAVSI
ncbi:MAG: hypothetical protein QXH32_08390 [Candidatus Caldarchaeum sp.]